MDAGANTAGNIAGLVPGQTYYFAVTAYDATGSKSLPSNEVAFVTPGILRMTSASSTNLPGTLSFPVAPTHWYEVQATANLKTWTTIWQTAPATSNAWVQFSDPKAKSLSSRFYRLVLQSATSGKAGGLKR